MRITELLFIDKPRLLQTLLFVRFGALRELPASIGVLTAMIKLTLDDSGLTDVSLSIESCTALCSLMLVVLAAARHDVRAFKTLT